jgi:serine/threonine protein kinase
MSTLKIGTILNGEYRIEAILGVGGFGITYLARDNNLRMRVVIKEFFPQSMALRQEDGQTVRPHPEHRKSYDHLRKRFSEEARLLAQMHHPNVVPVLRFFTTNGTAYFVMEYHAGETLKSYLERKKRLSEEEILGIMMPILEGTKYVHSQGFLHRDIAPDNIYLPHRGMPILIDFGAARDALARESRNISAIVKEGYSAPEQYTVNNRQNASADIYALGAVFYRLITGEAPPGAARRQSALLNGEADPLRYLPRTHAPRYSAKLLHAVVKAMHLRASDRFANVEAFQAALLGDVPVDSTPSPISRSIASIENDGGNRTLWFLWFTLLLLFLGGVGGYLALRHEGSSAPRAESFSSTSGEKAVSGSETTRPKPSGPQALPGTSGTVASREGGEKALESSLDSPEGSPSSSPRTRRANLVPPPVEANPPTTQAPALPELKTLSFTGSGGEITLFYPSFTHPGTTFLLRAQLHNSGPSVRQGGLTLSFPGVSSLPTQLVRRSFDRVTLYPVPSTLYSGIYHRKIRSGDFVVEGWERRWGAGETKSFTIRLQSPRNRDRLRILVRGVFVNRHKRERRVPTSSSLRDQQGYPVREITIPIVR